MSGSYRRTDPVDHLVINGESILLYQDRFIRLGPLGTCIVAAASTPRTIANLAAEVTNAFGEPDHGSAVDATCAAVAELVAHGVLCQAQGD